MKCPVDPDTFWCKRHQTTHIGRMYDLSQDESDVGERFRVRWDREVKKNKNVISKKSFNRNKRELPPSGGCNCGK
jgi:hypothetical protein